MKQNFNTANAILWVACSVCLLCFVCNNAFAQQPRYTPQPASSGQPITFGKTTPAAPLPVSKNTVATNTTVVAASQPDQKTTSSQTADKLLLKPKKTSFLSRSTKNSSKAVPGSPQSMMYTFGVLAVIVIGILVGTKVLKKRHPSLVGQSLPEEALETLGRRGVNQKQSIHMFRCGSRILLIGSGDDGLRTLAEITEPVEVDYLSGICRMDESKQGKNNLFRNLFQKAFSSDAKRQQSTQQQTQQTEPKQNRSTQPLTQPLTQPPVMENLSRISEQGHYNQIADQLDRAVQQQQQNQQRADQRRHSGNPGGRNV